MFPVYFLAIRNKDNKTVNYAIVNGQTGKVAADLPIAFSKYFLASFILSVILFLLIDNFFVFTPKVIAGIAIAFSALSLIISLVQATRLYKSEYHMDDLGFMSKEENANS